MDIEVEDTEEVRDKINDDAGWDQFRPIPRTVETLGEDDAIVVRNMDENTVKSLRSFMRYYMDDEDYRMRQSKQVDGTVTAVIDRP